MSDWPARWERERGRDREMVVHKRADETTGLCGVEFVPRQANGGRLSQRWSRVTCCACLRLRDAARAALQPGDVPGGGEDENR